MMGVVAELPRYRREIAHQSGQRCTWCGTLTFERRQWGEEKLCEACEAKLLTLAATPARSW